MIFSQPLSISSRKKRYSRDMKQFSFNVRRNLGANPFARHKIHRPAEQVFQEKFQIHVSIERRGPLKLHNKIYITVTPHLVAGGRSKKRQRLHLELCRQSASFRFQFFYNFIAFHVSYPPRITSRQKIPYLLAFIPVTQDSTSGWRVVL